MITTLGREPSFGFGDRLGMATPGHALALQKFGGGVRGVFAQQSIREMTRTGRTPQQVMDDAEQGLFRVGFVEPRGADADHLKTSRDVDAVMDAGFSFFTIDPSDHVDNQADDYTVDQVFEKYDLLEWKPAWMERYSGQTVALEDGLKLSLDEISLKRCAIKYGRALEETIGLGEYIVQRAESGSRSVEIELSIDETDQPTTPLEHFVFADQLNAREIPLVSIAPRFHGNFEKGIDFWGDRSRFEETLKQHAAVSRYFNSYKLSLHSGSDKLSIYESFARQTRGCFHVKTAGTSYLEALRVIGTTDEQLFREIVMFSRGRFEEDRATYHLSSGLGDAVHPGDLRDGGALLAEYMEKNAGRQILHVTFGSVVNDEQLGPRFRRNLAENQEVYTDFLVEHFGRHLQPLTSGMAGLS
ncbi:MAG: tagaturonate epimerase family protein [Planctomycetota bacterium]|nr:tagaturonate epimerase family protein [Planctomycetota bacterium]